MPRLFQVKKFGPIFGFYFGSTPAVILADYEIIKEAFKLDALAARPDLNPGWLRPYDT
jgi:Cytochrome P450